MRAKTFLTLDSETTGLGSKAIVFDLAYTIATRKNTLLQRTFLVREILTNPACMLGALSDAHWRDSFGGKLFRDYIPAINAGEMKLYPWREIIETMRDDMQTHNVSVFAAYNLKFDMTALAKTHAKVGRQDKILPYKMDLLDLWKFSCSAVLNTRLYHDFARLHGIEKGFITAANNVRTTAEKTYAYLTQNADFIEDHTALSDAIIETEILQRLLAKKKTIPYNQVDHMPWKYAQRLEGKLLQNVNTYKPV